MNLAGCIFQQRKVMVQSDQIDQIQNFVHNDVRVMQAKKDIESVRNKEIV